MGAKAGLVAPLSAAAGDNQARGTTRPATTETPGQRSVDFVKAVIEGLVRLSEGQRQFADEFGLSLSRVFPNSFEALESHEPRDVVNTLFRSGSNSIAELERLFDDLIMHQVALFGALDGIALETLYQLAPDRLREEHPGRKPNDSRCWRFFGERVDELLNNDGLRFQSLISGGFVDSYVRLREVNRKAMNQTSG